MMGAERRSMVMTEEEKKLTAYHEAGHAIVTINEKAAHPIHKATIIPRGRALGMVMQLPERDEFSQTREQLHAQMAIAMGGRVAEEIIFGDDKVTTGASSDIEQATKRARAMVMKAGLSKELGPVAYGENEEEVFLGRSVARQQHMSEETAKKVDIEIRKIVDKGYERAKKVLTEKIDDLHKLAKALLTYETLTGDEIEDLINKNIYPANKEDLKVEEEEKGSALGSMGLKAKNSSLNIMKKYYTRACNFYYGNNSKKLIKQKKTLPLNGNSEISFDHIEILSRNYKKKIHIKEDKKLPKFLKKKLIKILKIIIKKKKNFSNFNFKNIPNIMGILNLTPDSFSDGGKFNKKSLGYKKQLSNYYKSGSNIIDVGGESTRPGSKEIKSKK